MRLLRPPSTPCSRHHRDVERTLRAQLSLHLLRRNDGSTRILHKLCGVSHRFESRSSHVRHAVATISISSCAYYRCPIEPVPWTSRVHVNADAPGTSFSDIVDCSKHGLPTEHFTNNVLQSLGIDKTMYLEATRSGGIGRFQSLTGTEMALLSDNQAKVYKHLTEHPEGYGPNMFERAFCHAFAFLDPVFHHTV